MTWWTRKMPLATGKYWVAAQLDAEGTRFEVTGPHTVALKPTRGGV